MAHKRLLLAVGLGLALVGAAAVLASVLVKQSNLRLPPAEADAKIVRFLAAKTPTLAEEHNFNGVVLFARGDEALYCQAFGRANRADSSPNETSTRFNLASASKMFTAVAIAKLVEDGQLSYDDPIGKHLGSDWVSAGAGAKILVRHLLNHTSGLGMYWGDNWDAVSARIRTIADFRQVVSDALAFEPGTKYQYSNTGYILLGAIIEKITGETYYDYVRHLIFEPCRMASTGFDPTNVAQPGFAVGYFEDKESGGKLTDNLGLHGAVGASAGGGWSTAGDLLRFFRAMCSDRIVSAGTREILWTPKPLTARYGYGFQIGDGFSGPGWIGHNGGFPGIEAFANTHPASGHTFIVLSNYYDSALPLMKAMKSQLQRYYEGRKASP